MGMASTMNGNAECLRCLYLIFLNKVIEVHICSFATYMTKTP